MEELFTDNPEITNDTHDGDDTFILYDSVEQPTEDFFSDLPSVNPPVQPVPEAVTPTPEPVENAPDAEDGEKPVSETEGIPTQVFVQSEDMTLLLEEVQKLQETIAQIQETNSLMQADFQKQAERQNQYYQYSFLVLIMLFSAVVIALLFSKIKV